MISHRWFRAASVNIALGEALNLLTYRNKALLITLTYNLQHTLIQSEVAKLQTIEFRYPEGYIKQGQNDDIVSVSFSGSGIYGIE